VNVDTEEYDLAFLDLMMPRVDGFEVLKALQARHISYPVIVLSAISQRDAMIKAIQMGVKSYLVKPLKPEDIFVKSIEILKANF
jgi:DNA-binding response OmpR family regulator